MYSLIKEKRSLRKGNGLFINYRYLAKVKEKGNQDRYEEGAQHSVEYGKNYRFFICIFQKYRKCGILTGCGSRGDAGAVIQLCCNYGNQEKGEKFSHKIAHKSDTAKFGSPQAADGDTCQTVPSHTACHGGTLIHRDFQDQGTEDSAQNRAGSDTKRDDQDFQVILTYFFQDSVMHTDTDAHRKHQNIQDHIGIFADKADNLGFSSGESAEKPQDQGKKCQYNNHWSFPFVSFLSIKCLVRI